jgi:hypothetical protein
VSYLNTPLDYLQEALRMLREDEKGEIDAFEKRMAGLRSRIRATEQALSTFNVDSSQTVLPLAPSPIIGPDRSSPAAVQMDDLDLIKRLKNLTQPEALVEIATQRGGLIRTAEAKDLMIRAGNIKGNPKNAYNHVFQLMKDEDRLARWHVRFEKEGAGIYRMVSTSVESPRQEKLSETASCESAQLNTSHLVIEGRS